MRFNTFIFLILFLSFDVYAQSLNSAQRDRPIKASISAPEIDAKAWAIMEMNSGLVVASHNGREPMPPASIT